MIPTTPAQDRYTRFSCPNPACLLCAVPSRLVLDRPRQKDYGRGQVGAAGHSPVRQAVRGNDSQERRPAYEEPTLECLPADTS